jgi:hypothetical protein
MKEGKMVGRIEVRKGKGIEVRPEEETEEMTEGEIETRIGVAKR